ncbi:MAG: hydroxymethylglutaryl-CoA lyase, partial [Kutzneria sp.]|nr:hydroxymethylglutaryl-CoA lyase [Kutzneria sp.]
MTARSVGLPTVTAAADLPASVQIWEVGARDGLQNEASIVDVATKLEFLDRLADAGLRILEATSFVHPRWVPQLADAEQVLAGLRRRQDVTYPV